MRSKAPLGASMTRARRRHLRLVPCPASGDERQLAGQRPDSVRVMTAELEGTAVAITGASSGIGEATALACARAGAAVALGARRADRLRDLAARIAEEGGHAEALEVDVADEASARAFV